jgi:hypothetical protein
MNKSKNNTILRYCQICNKEFYTNSSRLKIGYGKFCSRDCYAKSIKRDEVERFLEKVSPEDTNNCMLWLSGTSPDGYGKFKIDVGKTVRAHRYMWELVNDFIPNGLCVCHHCDNPLCVNPKHLFLGTSKDNTIDKVSKGRGSFGIKHGNSKLVDEDIRNIRKLYEDGYTYQKIAKLYGVVKSTIRIIIVGKTWKHVK